MRRDSVYFLVALLYGVIGQSYGAPNIQPFESLVNKTTTAEPPINSSLILHNEHTATGTSSTPTVATTTTEKLTTNMAFDSKKSSTEKHSTTASYRTTFSPVQHKNDFEITTAAPPFVGPTASYRQFDALSFTGGALLAICIAIIGMMVWKMYIAHVERRYWTL